MNSRLGFFFFSNLYVYGFLFEKLLGLNFYYLIPYRGMKFHFLFKSLKSNRLLFLMILMLMNKFLGSKVNFVYNDKLMRSSFVKIGCFFELGVQKFYDYSVMIFLHSLPKIFFGLSKKKDFFFLTDSKYKVYQEVFFPLKKIMFFNFFSSNLDYTKYKNFFEKSVFQLKLKVSTCFKFFLLNRDLLRLLGTNII